MKKKNRGTLYLIFQRLYCFKMNIHCIENNSPHAGPDFTLYRHNGISDIPRETIYECSIKFTHSLINYLISWAGNLIINKNNIAENGTTIWLSRGATILCHIQHIKACTAIWFTFTVVQQYLFQ